MSPVCNESFFREIRQDSASFEKSNEGRNPVFYIVCPGTFFASGIKIIVIWCMCEHVPFFRPCSYPPIVPYVKAQSKGRDSAQACWAGVPTGVPARRPNALGQNYVL